MYSFVHSYSQGSKEGSADTESREGSSSPRDGEGGEENGQAASQAAGDAVVPLSDGTATPGEGSLLVTAACLLGLLI